MVNHSAGNLSSFLDRPIFFSLFSPLGREQGKKMRPVFLLLDFWFLLRLQVFFIPKKTCSLIFSSLQTSQTLSRGRSHLVGGFERGFAKKKVGPPPDISEIKDGWGGGKAKRILQMFQRWRFYFFPHSFIQTSASFFFFCVIYRFLPPTPHPQMFQPSLVGARGRLLCILRILRVIRYFYFNFLITRLVFPRFKFWASPRGPRDRMS